MPRVLIVFLIACGGGNASTPPPVTPNPPPDPAPPPSQPMVASSGELCHDSTAACAIQSLTVLTGWMCDCKDKACADKVNEDMTRWGTEMAKHTTVNGPKPTEADAKQMTEIATRYAECLTKRMMQDATPPADPCGGGDPCGGH